MATGICLQSRSLHCQQQPGRLCDHFPQACPCCISTGIDNHPAIYQGLYCQCCLLNDEIRPIDTFNSILWVIDWPEVTDAQVWQDFGWNQLWLGQGLIGEENIPGCIEAYVCYYAYRSGWYQAKYEKQKWCIENRLTPESVNVKMEFSTAAVKLENTEELIRLWNRAL